MSSAHLWVVTVGHSVTGNNLIHKQQVKVAVSGIASSAERIVKMAYASYARDWDADPIQPKLLRSKDLKLGFSGMAYAGLVELADKE